MCWIEIPNRALFKAAEVCDLVQVQPYVLRTWEAEFPNLGVAKAAGLNQRSEVRVPGPKMGSPVWRARIGFSPSKVPALLH